jgi:hypothetical protein
LRNRWSPPPPKPAGGGGESRIDAFIKTVSIRVALILQIFAVLSNLGFSYKLFGGPHP